MEEHSVGYVPNLSERIGAAEAGGGASYPVYFGQPNDVHVFSAAYGNDSWFALSFAFSPQFSGDFNYFSYAGFSVSNLGQWTGNYQSFAHWAGTLISDWDFEIRLKEVYSTEYQLTFVAVYETFDGIMSLLADEFEEIEI